MSKIAKEIVLVPGVSLRLEMPVEHGEKFANDLIEAIEILLKEKNYLGSYLKARDVLATRGLSIFDAPFMKTLLSIYTKKLAPAMHTYMVNDSSRNDSFHNAIIKAMEKAGDKIVLDIGSGSGILAMMCAKEGVGEKEIIACEVNPLVADLCELTLKQNGLDKRIKLVKKKSSELEVGEHLSDKADILVSEVIADNIISEGIISTVNHAHEQLLKKGGTVIPKRACLYGVLIEDQSLREQSKFPETVNGFDMTGMQNIFNSEILYPDEYFVRNINSNKHLSDKVELFDFDFTKKVAVHQESLISVRATHSGSLHGLLLFFTLDVDDDNTINSLDEASCWIPKFIPHYGNKKIAKGDLIEFVCSYQSGLPFINVDWRE